MGEILRENSVLCPITVNEFGQFGSLFMRHLYGTQAMPLPVFKPDEKNAKAMATLCRSDKLPRGILPKANRIWKQEHPEEFYGFSYKAMDPMTWAEQQLGLVTSTAISNQILRAYGKVKTKPIPPKEKNHFGSLLKDDACIFSFNPRQKRTRNVGSGTREAPKRPPLNTWSYLA